ncbi:MAG: peptidase S41, partial [Planctomycetota bacterium]
MIRRPLAASLLASAGLAAPALAQDDTPHAGMLRHPDVSASEIVFVYANDLWIVSRDGGQARPLASPAGQEMFPKFSPDGSRVVFQGNYDGDRDLYSMPTTGGLPNRLTHRPGPEMPTDWTADDQIAFFTFADRDGITSPRMYSVPPDGGLPGKMPIEYGANGVVSDDGRWLAYTPFWRDSRTWKRYKGGMAADVWLFNLETNESRQITDWDGTDTLPMWHGDTVYYLSDAGPEHRLNVWAYDTETERRRQITEFTEFDVKFPSIGPGPEGQGEIVFQLGDELRLVDLSTGQSRVINVTVPGARPALRPQAVEAGQNMAGGGISSTGKRAVVEARGDIWTVPADNGPIRQITDTSGAAERSPAWSPDGRWIAYFSDEDGEYELYLTQSDGKGETRQLTDGNETFFFSSTWSPDSESILVTDKAGRMLLVDVETGDMTEI